MKTTALTALGIMCALAGQYLAYRLNMHVRLLEEIEMMFNIIESDIQYLCRPAQETVSMLASKDELKNLKFLAQCNLLMQDGRNFKDAWKESLKEKSRTCFLEKEDIDMLASFGNLFGISDSAGQVSNCRMHSEIVKDKLDYARIKRDRYASLSCGMGAILGIGMIIIFI